MKGGVFRRIVCDVTTSKEVTHPEESAAVEHRGRLFLYLQLLYLQPR
jgi:hypothetical protein